MKIMKKILIIIVILIVLAVAWYLISPLFRTVELNEASPITDDFEMMDEMTRVDFKNQVQMMPNQITPTQDEMPTGPVVLSQAEFQPRAHDVSGQALLIESNGQRILRFENFETVNGPNLHIYLASTLGSEDFVDLGPIKATKGNINYELSSEVDLTKYNKVLVWCVPFRVLFSYAEL